MHNPFPVKPFRCTVRLPPSHNAPTPQGYGFVSAHGTETNELGHGKMKMIASEIGNIAAGLISQNIPTVGFTTMASRGNDMSETVVDGDDCCSVEGDMTNIPIVVTDHNAAYVSPTSFPPTPFSRNRVMNLSSQRVDSTMFYVRDRLRLEEQSGSRDAVARRAAKKAKDTGQLAVYDVNNASEGMALCCGNHCAMKVGSGTCCSCRSTVPILRNCWVYLEFSITVSGSQVPSVSVGLVAPDTPLNVMVGSWENSLGLNSDGQLLAGSRWFPSDDTVTMLLPGTTVGMLVYVRSQYDLEHLDSVGFTSSLLKSGSSQKLKRRSRGCSFDEHSYIMGGESAHPIELDEGDYDDEDGYSGEYDYCGDGEDEDDGVHSELSSYFTGTDSNSQYASGTLSENSGDDDCSRSISLSDLLYSPISTLNRIFKYDGRSGGDISPVLLSSRSNRSLPSSQVDSGCTPAHPIYSSTGGSRRYSTSKPFAYRLLQPIIDWIVWMCLLVLSIGSYLETLLNYCFIIPVVFGSSTSICHDMSHIVLTSRDAILRSPYQHGKIHKAGSNKNLTTAVLLKNNVSVNHSISSGSYDSSVGRESNMKKHALSDLPLNADDLDADLHCNESDSGALSTSQQWHVGTSLASPSDSANSGNKLMRGSGNTTINRNGMAGKSASSLDRLVSIGSGSTAGNTLHNSHSNSHSNIQMYSNQSSKRFSSDSLRPSASPSNIPAPEQSNIKLKFNINGRVKSFRDEEAAKIAMNNMELGDVENIYPCISILTENTRVWNRFCEADIVYKQRRQIGAPPGTKVYCLDGSLLLSESD